MSKIKCSHTESVAAGTIVRFWVPDAAQRADQAFLWTVTGPRSQDRLEIPTSGPHLDWDTTGRAPGAYDVIAVADHGGTPGDSGAATAADEPDTGAGSPLPEVPRRIDVGDDEPNDGRRTDDRRSSRDDDLPSFVHAGFAESGSYEPFTLRVTPASATAHTSGAVPVSLQRNALVPTSDQVLWVVIRNRTGAISFRRYQSYIDGVMGGTGHLSREEPLQAFRGPHAYDLLMRATEAFLMQETGVLGGAGLHPQSALDDLRQQVGRPGGQRRLDDEEGRRLGRTRVTVNDLEDMRQAYYERLCHEEPSLLPYLGRIRQRLSEVPLKCPEDVVDGTYGILPSSLTGPVAIELIWSYWHEEGMLVQTLNAILARFQNRKSGLRDPLARFDLDPLRPLANLFWGWVQDEMKRLTVRRRSFEYEHEYGLRLIGRAVPSSAAADRRSRFLESLHNLLYLSHVFFKEDDDTTVLADGFPVLNALRETHLVLAEGAHNQFGDLPTTARVEMLVMQWLLARPEMREFLGGRVMVPYEEPWMDRVDSMRAMQGWGGTSVAHFRDMAVYGEQLLLSIRYGDWSSVNDPQQAANWARYWRPEVQRYTHAYRSATGIDLSERVDATSPSLLLHRRFGAARLAGG